MALCQILEHHHHPVVQCQSNTRNQAWAGLLTRDSIQIPPVSSLKSTRNTRSTMRAAMRKSQRCVSTTYTYSSRQNVSDIQYRLRRPMLPNCDEVQLTVQLGNPDNLRRTDQKCSVPGCAMRSYDRTEPALIFDLENTGQKASTSIHSHTAAYSSLCRYSPTKVSFNPQPLYHNTSQINERITKVDHPQYASS